MLLEISKQKINFIGDPHLGKKFNNVPLHRKGEREKLQFEEFKKQLDIQCDVNIMVGDLFDVFDIPNELLLEVVNAIRQAKRNNPETMFIMMSGNHDISRDSSIKSSFHVLKEILRHEPTVHICMEEQAFYSGDLHFLVCPYNEFKNSEEAIAPFKDKIFNFVVGHWDTMLIAGTHNVVPPSLVNMTNLIITGHVHTPDTFYLDANGNLVKTQTHCKVLLTGSMQPYSHGEDPKGEFYVTRTVDQVVQELEENPEAYKYKALRIIAVAGEVIPEGIDCLQFATKIVEGEEEKLEVTLGDFSFRKEFDDVMTENDVPTDVATKYWEIYQQKATDAKIA